MSTSNKKTFYILTLQNPIIKPVAFYPPNTNTIQQKVLVFHSTQYHPIKTIDTVYPIT